jgi:hypothetical protein
MGLGSFAAHLIKAPAEPVPFISPVPHELPGIEVHPPFTVVMDSLSVAKEWAETSISGRKGSEG